MADTRQTPGGSPWVVPEPVWAAGAPQADLADAPSAADSSAAAEQPTLAHDVLPPVPSRRAEWRYRMAMRRSDWRAERERRAWERHNRPIPPSGPAAWFVGDSVTLARRFAPLGLLFVAGAVALAVALSGNSSNPSKSTAGTPATAAPLASVTASGPRAAAHHRGARPAHRHRRHHAVRAGAHHRAKPKAHTAGPVVSTPTAPVVAAAPVYTPAYTPTPAPVVTPTPTPTPTPRPVATKPAASSSPPIAATKGTAPTSLPGRTPTGG
ncbi:MAG: hypothetical protein ACYDHH_01815 [Solirubrobacteraceae bacterium]